MRSAIQTIYLGLMRLLGLYGVALVLWFATNLPSQIAQGLFVKVPMVMAAVGFAICLVLLIPRLTPSFFGRPSQMWHLFPVLLGHGFLTLVFAILSLLVGTGLGLPDDQGKSVTVFIAAPAIVATGALWWIGLALCVWPVNGGPQRPARHGVPDPQPHVVPAASPDARDLRLLRMT